MILLDTNVVSEMMRSNPHPAVRAYVRAQQAADLFLPSICEGELRYGIARLPSGRRRAELAASFEAFLARGFGGRIVSYDSASASAYAAVRAAREAAGRPLEMPDLQIIGMALAHGAAIATRNVSDFAGSGVTVINPWDYRP